MCVRVSECGRILAEMPIDVIFEKPPPLDTKPISNIRTCETSVTRVDVAAATRNVRPGHAHLCPLLLARLIPIEVEVRSRNEPMTI